MQSIQPSPQSPATRSLSGSGVVTVTNTADSGAGSLRAALAAVPAGGTIRFATNLANKTITLTSGQLEVAKKLTIDATGVDNLTISGNNRSRVFVVKENINASFKNLTVINGTTTEGGGGIMVGKNGTLMVANSRFNGNKAGVGGAIRLNYGAKGTVLNSSFDSNDGTSANSGFSGGAIATYGSGSLVVRGSRFTNNRGINGGAIYSLLGPLTVENSVFLNNRSGGKIGGGAIFTDGGNPVGPTTTQGGTITVRGSWFEGNQTRGEGGALFLYGYKDKILLENSTVINNVADVDQKGVGRGGGLRANSELTIRNVTFANNRAAKQGGGLWLDGNLPVNIINTTFSGNQATADAGGAMFLNTRDAKTNIVNATVVNNSAGRANGAMWMNLTSSQLVTLTNSIVANNTATDRSQQQIGYQPRDGGGNIEFPAPVAGGRRVANSSLIADPKLGALQNIGGVLVHPLSAGSPAINGAKAGAAPAIDQRGVNRDAAPDVGTYEVVAGSSRTSLNQSQVTQTQPLATATQTQTSGKTNPRVVNGTQDDDRLRGRSGKDTLAGKSGDDVLIGGAGDDILIGGMGNDKLTGGKNRDRFVYLNLSEGVDTIKDFEQQKDVIDLSNVSGNPQLNQRSPWRELIRLDQVGSSTVVLVNTSSDENHQNFRKLVSLENVNANSISAENFLL